MNGFDEEDFGCTASSGVMGHLSCRNCTCGANDPDPEPRGEQAGYALQETINMENLRRDFMNFNMDREEAVDLGFIDSSGCLEDHLFHSSDNLDVLPMKVRGHLSESEDASYDCYVPEGGWDESPNYELGGLDFDKILGKGNKPTEQQLDITHAYSDGDSLCVEARAGAAKTSTSLLLAESDPDKRILYLAFNRHVIEEARGKMPSNVDVRTFHSLAYRAIGHEYQHKLKRPQGRYRNVGGTVSEIAKLLKIEGSYPLKIASLVKSTITSFCNDDTKGISTENIPSSELHRIMDIINEPVTPQLCKMIVKYAKMLWEMQIDVDNDILITHDHYLKLYQLSKPTIKGIDVIIMDEGQDVTPCVLDIVLKQKEVQIVLVGDSHQAIYQWKGCVNAFQDDRLSGFTHLELSQSFRFGKSIADQAERVLESVSIEGFGDKSQVKCIPKGEQYTKIYRSNINMVLDSLDLIAAGFSVDIRADVKDLVSKLKSVRMLKDGKKPKHGDIVIYDSFEELEADAESGNSELHRLVNLIKTRRDLKVISELQNYRNPVCGDIILTTAHKSKGLEYDYVVLADDFPEMEKLNYIERNLLYVAATRAKKILQINAVLEEINKKTLDATKITK